MTKAYKIPLLASSVVALAATLSLWLPIEPADSPRLAAQAEPATTVAKQTRTVRRTPVRKSQPRSAPVADDRVVIPVSFPEPGKITIAISAAPQLVKLDGNQNPLADDAKEWDCVKDLTTGLVWEVKTHDKGLQDANNFYSWYQPGQVSGLANNGYPNFGKCLGGINCDTRSYVDAINKKRLCGYSDWRLPTRAELMSLVSAGNQGPQDSVIDSRFFPATPGDWYWTADTDAGDPGHAWFVLFNNGRSLKALKSQAKRVRLVRGNKKPQRRFKEMAKKKRAAPVREIAEKPRQLSPAGTENGEPQAATQAS